MSNSEEYLVNVISNMAAEYLDGKRVDLHCVAKLAPRDDRYRISGAIMLFFSKEIFIYSRILPSYKEHQKRYSPHLLYVSPQCYYICQEHCKETLVLEDMRSQGYKLYAEKYLDYDHVKVSIVALAKLHGLSFILKEKECDLYKDFTDVCVPLNAITNKRFMIILEDRLDKAVQMLSNSKYATLLKELKLNYSKYIDNLVTSVCRTAICHGDLWKENILYKYENDKPVLACIIDYQTVRLSSPAYDFLFLIMTSVDTNLRLDHFADLVKTYYDTFESILSEDDLRADNIYSLDQFQSDLSTCTAASFIVANTAIWLSSGLQQEGHVRSKVELITKDDRIKAEQSYRDVVAAILEDFSNYGYFNLCY